MKHLLLVVMLAAPALLFADCRGLAPARGVPAATEDQWTLATMNLWRLRDATRDSDLDQPLSRHVLRRRLDAVANYIVGPLQAPHLLAVQEVENQALLDALGQRLARQGYRYRSVLIEGNDPSGMDVALLYRAPVRLRGQSALFAEADFHGHSLFSRPPLRVQIAAPVEAELVVVHLRSARDLKQSRVYQKRRQQATMLAQWVRQHADGAVMVVGDFNSSWGQGRFSDSYNRFRSAQLFNVWEMVPELQRYSYRYRCRPQALDHIWVSPSLKTQIESLAVSRGHAGRYKALYGSNGVSPISDHDVPVLYFGR